MKLTTKRLNIRPLNEADFFAFQTVIKQEMALHELDVNEAQEKIQEIFNQCLQHDEQTKTLALIDRETQAYVGHIGFAPDFHAPHLQLFWAIEAKYRRQGYATEALETLIKFIPKPVEAYIQLQNEASLALAQKLKMTYVGVYDVLSVNTVILNYRLEK